MVTSLVTRQAVYPGCASRAWCDNSRIPYQGCENRYRMVILPYSQQIEISALTPQIGFENVLGDSIE